MRGFYSDWAILTWSIRVYVNTASVVAVKLKYVLIYKTQISTYFNFKICTNLCSQKVNW